MTPPIAWHMSAIFKNVPRGDAERAEVTSLESTVRVWPELDGEYRGKTVLTPEHPILIDGAFHSSFTAEGIPELINRLPGSSAMQTV